jgi:type IV pilus assembly protein PilC
MSPVIRTNSIAAAKTPVVTAPPLAQPRQGFARPLKKITKITGARKIVNKDVPAFSRQLAAMLSAGMPIVVSLETLEEQAANPSFKYALGELRKNIENGSSYSESLAKLPTIFDELYVNMVRAGERSGQLSETMKRIAALLESDAKLKRKVKSALMYPTIVLCVALIIATGMILFIVPVFAEMFSDFGAKLPGPTQFLVDLSKNAKRYAPIIVPLIAVGIYLFNKWKKTNKGADTMDALYLKAPVFGVLIQKVAVARFSRTLSQLVSSGVPILAGLDIVSKATGNRIIGKAILDARAFVERGDTLSNGLTGKKCLPTIMVRMLAAGEKTGKVDEMLDSIADTFDDEVEAMLAGLTSLLEPLLMVFLGVIIGGIVICMFLPIFKMGEVVSGG